MRAAIAFFVLLSLTITTIYFIDSNDISTPYPIPTDGTMIKSDMEEKSQKNAREKWFEELHKSEEGVNWKQVEYENSMERQKTRPISASRDNTVDIAEGQLLGKWLERGSNNQAGSVFDIDFDIEDNLLYLVSAGGSIFKADFDIQYWEVVNDRFKFNPGLLKIMKLEDGSKRMVALINKEPHYSDDLGLNWTKADSYSAEGWANVKDAYVTTIDGEELIFILVRLGGWSDFHLYLSKDLGQSYESIHTFNTSDADNLAMAKVGNSGEIIVIEQTQVNLSKIHKYDPETNQLLTVVNQSPIAFGQDGRGNLAAVLTESDTLNMYSYNGSEKLFLSQDTGKTWNQLSTLPVRPWGVRLFVSPSNPDVLMIGAVECYRSHNGGKSWNLINTWGEYYSDVYGKLHADIMHFDEFTDPYGDIFNTISNHGGLSISYDGGKNNINIGLYDLNVSQYYSVRTSPKNTNLVTAGSQDQGLQRGFILGQSTVNLDQVISGDYGHNVFTMNGDRFWTVYPGGWISHYSYPASGYLDAGWTLESDNESVWIPPIIEGPDPSKDQVILAGGNMNGGSGSYLIKLTYEFGSINKEQLDFDFRAASGSEISAIAISPINKQKWFVATSNGKFYYSEDSGQNWTSSSNNVPGSHYLYGSCILPSKLDENIVYLSGSGYSTAGVRVSYDGGQTFEAMNTNLPSTMVFGITANEDETKIFAATESGPYVYLQQEDSWYDMAGEIAPTQSYWSIEYIPQNKVVRFGTYGRGIWDFEIDDSATSNELSDKRENDFYIYPNPAEDFVTITSNASISEKTIVAIYDASGKKLFETEMSAGTQSKRMNISSLPSGNYHIVLKGKEHLSNLKLLIK